MMNYHDFACPDCMHYPLQLGEKHLMCPACKGHYVIQDSVPLLFPSRELSASVGGRDFSLLEVQGVYDKVYTHDGLMGTDLDAVYDQVTKETLLGFGGLLDQKRVLDVGTGVGRLWGYVPSSVIGYALEPSVVGAVKTYQRYPHLTVSASVGESLPYQDEFFDMVISADTIEHTLSPQQTLVEIFRVLKPGGTFSASFPIPDSLRKWGWNQIIKRRFDPVFLFRLGWVVFKRILIFGKATFQPIDRDLDNWTWLQMIEEVGFNVKEVIEWPEAPELPIVYLVHALKR